MVVKSALIHGGLGKKSIEEIHQLMSNHSMHVPSPLRLLRIVNGKQCEFCFRRTQKKVNHVRPGLGVFACWNCVTERCPNAAINGSRGSLTKVWKRSWARYKRDGTNKYRTIFNHPRVAASEYKDYYLWQEHYNDSLGEHIGPIVVWRNIDEMHSHFADVDAMNNAETGIDNYLTTNLNAPPIARYADFNNTFTEMKAKADAAVAEREEKKKANKANTKAKKKAAAIKIADDLTALIDEPWRELAMTYTMSPSFDRDDATLRSTPCLNFKTPFINDLVKPYILTPSKMKRATKTELVTSINEKLGMITGKNLLGMEFLSDNDPFEKALKDFLQEKIPDIQALFSFSSRCYNNSNKIDKSFISRLEDDKLLDTLTFILEGGHSVIGQLLLDVEPSATKAREAADYETETIDILVKSIWLHCLKETGFTYYIFSYSRSAGDDVDEKDSKQQYHEAFNASQTMFAEMLAAGEEYYTWLFEKNQSEARSKFQRNHAMIYMGWEKLLTIPRPFEEVNQSFPEWAWERHNRVQG